MGSYDAGVIISLVIMGLISLGGPISTATFVISAILYVPLAFLINKFTRHE